MHRDWFGKCGDQGFDEGLLESQTSFRIASWPTFLQLLCKVPARNRQPHKLLRRRTAKAIEDVPVYACWCGVAVCRQLSRN